MSPSTSTRELHSSRPFATSSNARKFCGPISLPRCRSYNWLVRLVCVPLRALQGPGTGNINLSICYGWLRLYGVQFAKFFTCLYTKNWVSQSSLFSRKVLRSSRSRLWLALPPSSVVEIACRIENLRGHSKPTVLLGRQAHRVLPGGDGMCRPGYNRQLPPFFQHYKRGRHLHRHSLSEMPAGKNLKHLVAQHSTTEQSAKPLLGRPWEQIPSITSASVPSGRIPLRGLYFLSPLSNQVRLPQVLSGRGHRSYFELDGER